MSDLSKHMCTPPPFFRGGGEGGWSLLSNFQKGGGLDKIFIFRGGCWGRGVKGGIDAVMHTMKLDVLLHKTRIKVPRFGIYTYMISLSKIAHQLWYNIGRGEGVIK